MISRPPAAALYWTAAQQLAHLTVNGAALRTGDLYASGTVSGPDRAESGCLLELTENGTHPLRLADGATRGFLEDGDEVVVAGTAPAADGGLLDLGEVRGRVTPAPGDAGR
ncbi:fumarylacetoacetate hydrolase family protein [Nocardioides sambongensis]|uniref:fumarylacetoacetate hydrolase family protein n=1 Tax=Nocardioides sambongensis TaxID=2589074 RepID=UPI0022ABB2A9|nr:fumarylacetoacetate hydrolase family protein [Nocardioides sambongensis]